MPIQNQFRQNQFRRIRKTAALILLPALLAGVAQGCAAAAVGAAGAGAAGGMAFTDRGAKGEVKGDVQTVNRRAEAAFRAMGIQITGTAMKNAGKEKDLKGKGGDRDVSVNMVQAGDQSTRVEVVARKGTLSWDKDYAKEILNRIVEHA